MGSQALNMAVSAARAVEFVGFEARIILSQAVIVGNCAKSNAAYLAGDQALRISKIEEQAKFGPPKGFSL